MPGTGVGELPMLEPFRAFLLNRHGKRRRTDIDAAKQLHGTDCRYLAHGQPPRLV
jgi:hypothetical protein